MSSIMWFRDDLRLADNPALLAATNDGGVAAVYILDEESEGLRPLGGAARWWLHQALTGLHNDLADRGIQLVLRRGPAATVISDLVKELEPESIYWNRRYWEPERAVDTAVKENSRAAGVHAESFQASLLHEPWKVTTGQGGQYRVFTPFWNQLKTVDFRHPLGPPPTCVDSDGSSQEKDIPTLVSDDLAAWKLVPTGATWPERLASHWIPGEAAAWRLLEEFSEDAMADYDKGHDFPGIAGTSRLSPYLRWGHISPFQLWHALSPVPSACTAGATAFLRQLGWREFCWHQLFHHPELASANLRPAFDGFDWRWPEEPGAATPARLRGVHRTTASTEQAVSVEPVDAWKAGRTGLPMVDAGMRQLWETGWMHNRVRMLVASFLTKNMGVHWQVGEQWFWETLVDADQASNPANWQWVAGSGADASPFFRIFNPHTQGKRFDAAGRYVSRWVPEATLPGYPEPIEDLAESRRRALADYDRMRKS